MDNLGSHKSSAVRQPLRAAGAKLFFLRKAARRTELTVYNAIVDLLPTIAATECANYFAKAGYART
jgi:putative transposase